MYTEAIKTAIALASGFTTRSGQVELNNAEVCLLADAVLQLSSLLQKPLDPAVAEGVVARTLPPELVMGDHAPCAHLRYLDAVLESDAEQTITADINYRGSWKRRGGTGAFHMLARKWDRLEPRVEAHGFDVFDAIKHDRRREGVIDDIRDLRRYLALVEAEAVRLGLVPVQVLGKDSVHAAD
jgi:hypothetical protein